MLVSLLKLLFLTTCFCHGFHPTVGIRLSTSLASETISNDLWIAGAGTLGSIVAQGLCKYVPTSKIIAETSTSKRHTALVACSTPRLRSSRSVCDLGMNKNVLISFPPTSSDDYVAEVAKSVELWSKSGTLLFVSSTAVYGNDLREIDEFSPVDITSPRSALLDAAERIVLAGGGNVVRFPGLYDASKGPHSFWRRLTEEGKTIDSDGESMLSLLHYEDAAQMCMNILLSGYHNTVFLGADDMPISRSDICKYSFGHTGLIPRFVGAKGTTSQRTINDTKSRALLGWAPRHSSFKEFMTPVEMS